MPLRRGRELYGRGQRVRGGTASWRTAPRRTAQLLIIDIKLVLCDTLPPRRRVWHARLAAGGFVFPFGSICQAQSRRTLLPRWCCEEALPFRTGTVFDTAPLHSFPRAICPRARRGQPQQEAAIDSPRAPYRQPSHICHRLVPRPLPTCNRSRPAQTPIKALRHRRLGTSSLVDGLGGATFYFVAVPHQTQ